MCLAEGDCPPGQTCTQGGCTLVPGGCQTDADCAAADRCSAGFCAPRPLDCLPDAAEDDDSVEAAAPLDVPARAPADFCDDAEDWRALTVEAGQAYSFATDLLSPGTDTRLELFDADGRTRLAMNDDALPGLSESRIDGWSTEVGGTVYLRVTHSGRGLRARTAATRCRPGRPARTTPRKTTTWSRRPAAWSSAPRPSRIAIATRTSPRSWRWPGAPT